jgi:N-acyl-D-amino-acid deacylase
MKTSLAFVLVAATLLQGVAAGAAAGAEGAEYDVVIRGGTIYDGSGRDPYKGDVALRGDRIAAVGALGSATGRQEIDASGLAVSPGFVDMVSGSFETLPVDGRAMSDVTQGVTLTLFGEGETFSIMNERMAKEIRSSLPAAYDYPLEWNSLDGFLTYLERRGVSVNFASLIGAVTVRKYVVGWDDRAPTPEELARMQELVRQGMREGAMGLGICISYDPARYTTTPELIALAKAAGEFGGIYATGMRSESGDVLAAVDEVISIARAAGVKANIDHAKVSGKAHWDQLDAFVRKVEAARAEGVQLYAGMYYYPALWTGLSSSIPPWAFDGGFARMLERTRDPELRPKILAAIRDPDGGYENFYALAGSPDKITFIRFKNEQLNHLLGHTLADAARERGKTPEETILDLLAENGDEIWAAFFTMSEEQVETKLKQPWMMFTSDSGAIAAEPPFTLASTHPRTYGNVPRLLGHYVRDRQLITLQEAIRKLTSLPASVLGITDRGLLATGNYADVVVFDPATIRDNATFEKPHQYSTGVRQVFVNGTQVLRDGVHTGAKPGRAVRGPGWVGRQPH